MKQIAFSAALISGAVLLGACNDGRGTMEPWFGAPQFASVAPALIEGAANKTCAELFPGVTGLVEFKIEGTALTNGVKPVAGTLSVTISNLGDDTFDWSSNFDIYGVFVKGGNGGSNLYTYFGTAFTRGDTQLAVPNPANNSISHITFCFVPKLAISKTATTSFTRTHHWDLEKTADKTTLVLMPGVQGTVNYAVTAVYKGFTDSNWSVSGTVTVSNPWPTTAVISGITDVLTPSNLSVTLNCGVTFPHSLASGQTLNCTYTKALSSAVSQVNTVVVTVTEGPVGGSATANVTFGAPTTQVDPCITVFDDKTNPSSPVSLGTACASDSVVQTTGKKVFTYASTFSFTRADCGEVELLNTASFDPAAGDPVTATHKVTVTVECPAGCTLTQGYWKTHSTLGPAPADQSGAWETVGGPHAAFFSSGKSWYGLFWTAPAGGNVFVQLAHQYMAAKLSILAGADDSAVASVIAAAEAFFPGKTPNTSLTASQRNQAKSWAAMLDAYNNGDIGPGHCEF